MSTTPEHRAATDIRPTVALASVGAAAATIVIWIVETTTGIDIPQLVEGSVTTIAVFTLGWLAKGN